MSKWIPQIIGWLIPALVSLALMYTRLAVVEHVQAEHERRLQILEAAVSTYSSTLLSIAQTVNRIDERLDKSPRR